MTTTRSTSVQKFKSVIAASGDTVSKAEIQKALKHFGEALSKTEKKALDSVLKKENLTPAAREAVANFVKTHTVGGGGGPQQAPELSRGRAAFIKAHVEDFTMRARFAMRPAADVLPVGVPFASVKASGYDVLLPVGRGQDANAVRKFFLRNDAGAAGPFELPVQLTTARAARELLQNNEALRNHAFDLAFGSSRSRSSSAVVSNVTKAGDGFEVEVQLVHWRTRVVQQTETLNLSSTGELSAPTRFTTMAVGEEDGGGAVTSQAIGEEDGGGGASTEAVGEEDGGAGGGGVTSQAIGEEDGGGASTEAVGEEDGGAGGGGVTSQAIGEEDGGAGGRGRGGVTSQAIGEEG
jgi:hypothetical protein